LLLIKKVCGIPQLVCLPEKPVSDAHAPFVLPENLKMVLSKIVMRNIAQFRIRGHGLKCETDLYGRSPDRSARVCNLCENGDIQDEIHVTPFFLIDLYVGTYRLSSHARLEAFVIQTRLKELILFFNLLIIGTYWPSGSTPEAQASRFEMQGQIKTVPLSSLEI